jgi:hypothetical protein
VGREGWEARRGAEDMLGVNLAFSAFPGLPWPSLVLSTDDPYDPHDLFKLQSLSSFFLIVHRDHQWITGNHQWSGFRKIAGDHTGIAGDHREPSTGSSGTIRKHAKVQKWFVIMGKGEQLKES